MLESIKPALGWIPYAVKQGPVYAYWSRFLARAEYWPRERAEQWQTERLREIVRHAITHTEGYRELYHKAGVKFEDIRSFSDVKRLPMVTKSMLRDNLAAYSVPRRGAQLTTTGGSTGIPFGFHVTRDDRRRESAFIHAGWRRAGWKPEMRTAVLRGSFVGAKDQLSRRDRFWNTLELTSYYLTSETIPQYVDILNRFQPEIFHAYPSSLLLLCDLLKESGLTLRSSPKLALLGSENLYDWQVQRFAEVMPSTRIFSWYGHAEMAVLAPWCEQTQRFHIWPYYGLTELLDESGSEAEPGDEGEIVGTALHIRPTPFIRYRTLDRAVKGPAGCPECGRAFETLERINGRLQEVIVTQTGRYISMTAINFHDSIFNSIRQFQFRQEKPGKILFQYVPKYELMAAEKADIARRLLVKLGDDVELEMQDVAEIALTASGKLRFLDQRLIIKYGDR